jgi:hypothetical protein
MMPESMMEAAMEWCGCEAAAKSAGADRRAAKTARRDRRRAEAASADRGRTESTAYWRCAEPTATA